MRQAARHIKNGEREEACRLLSQLLRAAPHDAAAWLLMSQAVTDKTRRRECLTRAQALASRQGRRSVASPRHITTTPSPSHPAPGSASTTGTTSQEPPPREPPSLDILAGGDGLAVSDITTRRGASRVTPSDAARRRGYRNIMIATALTFSLLCGLVLLITTAITVVPQAQARRAVTPTLETVLYTATLWCPPCAQAGSPVILWEKVGDGISRGGKVGELPHNTRVAVLAEVWSAQEQRMYYKVAAQGQRGWVPETFIKGAPPRR